ncbi:MAG: hypothetical protein E7K04_01450 [Helicobacter sp.]|nr:hypothetical protein [Helicobacter sp.]
MLHSKITDKESLLDFKASLAKINIKDESMHFALDRINPIAHEALGYLWFLCTKYNLSLSVPAQAKSALSALLPDLTIHINMSESNV